MACGKVLYCLKKSLLLALSWFITYSCLHLTNPRRGLSISLMIYFARRILDLNYWFFFARRLEELGAAVGALGGGPGASFARQGRGQGSWAVPLWLSAAIHQLEEKMDLSIFGFALDPERAGPTAPGGAPSLPAQREPAVWGDANGNFLQHQPPFLLPAPLRDPVPAPDPLIYMFGGKQGGETS